jgi:hypothetical protein
LIAISDVDAHRFWLKPLLFSLSDGFCLSLLDALCDGCLLHRFALIRPGVE